MNDKFVFEKNVIFLYFLKLEYLYEFNIQLFVLPYLAAFPPENGKKMRYKIKWIYCFKLKRDKSRWTDVKGINYAEQLIVIRNYSYFYHKFNAKIRSKKMGIVFYNFFPLFLIRGKCQQLALVKILLASIQYT